MGRPSSGCTPGEGHCPKTRRLFRTFWQRKRAKKGGSNAGQKSENWTRQEKQRSRPGEILSVSKVPSYETWFRTSHNLCSDSRRGSERSPATEWATEADERAGGN